jgi:hypothetical protein
MTSVCDRNNDELVHTAFHGLSKQPAVLGFVIEGIRNKKMEAAYLEVERGEVCRTGSGMELKEMCRY